MCVTTTILPISILRKETIGENHGPWIAVSGHLHAGDRVLGRYVWAIFSAVVVAKKHEAALVAELDIDSRPSNVPIDHYTFAGQIPWHDRFASVAISEDAYCKKVRVGAYEVDVEALAHDYAWESSDSELDIAGRARVPSQPFSARFDLRSKAQSFDQVLPDGSRATITVSGVDGLEGDVVYVREDILRQYAGDRAVVWFTFGERELHPYPSSPQQWLVDAQRQRMNAWHAVLTESDIKADEPARAQKKRKKPTAKRTVSTRATSTASSKPTIRAVQKVVAVKAPPKKKAKARLAENISKRRAERKRT
jgi:hypothetical protein